MELEPRFDQVIFHGGATQQITIRLNPLDFRDFVVWFEKNEVAKAALRIRAENFGVDDWERTFPISESEVTTIERYAKAFPGPI